MAATVDEMIGRIESYVNKRQLGVAECLACAFLDGDDCNPLQSSGYPILAIVLPYFEMIEQFSRGQTSRGRSKEFFVAGFKRVYPSTELAETDIFDIYEWVRCGMYHDGMTRNRTALSRFFHVGFSWCDGEIQINPALVVQEIRSHFDGYIARLRDPANASERECF